MENMNGCAKNHGTLKQYYAICRIYFQVFSLEGLNVIKNIIKREENRGVAKKSGRGNKISLRGLYYLSPWIRDLQNCPELRSHFRDIAGEDLVPHPSFCNSPQVISFL